jgi:hypothetical protein
MTMPAEQNTPGGANTIKLPRVTDAPTPATQETPEHNPVFALLVQSDTDTTGLLAYALYKQNKRDWLKAHHARDGKGPSEAELRSYILGESIPRRLSTYRRLAEDMLAADQTAPQQAGLLTGLMAPANDMTAARPALVQAAGKAITWRYIGFLLLMLVLMAVVFRLAAGWLFGTGR